MMKSAKDCGADGNCLFMLEAREGYYFTENYTGDFIKEITEKMLRLVKIYIWYAWILQQNLTMKQFLSRWERNKSGFTVPYMRLIDEGPTIARLLGLHLGKTDGAIVEDLLQL